MTAIELQDFLHVYSMLSFSDGSHAPGIVVNKYNVFTTQVDYYFIVHAHMQSYKTAFESYDRATCARLSKKIVPEEVLKIRPVSLADYKVIMQLMNEREELLKSDARNSGTME